MKTIRSRYFFELGERKKERKRERKREGNNFKTASCNREAIIGQITSIDKFTQKDLKTLKFVKASSSKFRSSYSDLSPNITIRFIDN